MTVSTNLLWGSMGAANAVPDNTPNHAPQEKLEQTSTEQLQNTEDPALFCFFV